MAQVQSLAWELPHAKCAAKKKKKRGRGVYHISCQIPVWALPKVIKMIIFTAYTPLELIEIVIANTCLNAYYVLTSIILFYVY